MYEVTRQEKQAVFAWLKEARTTNKPAAVATAQNRKLHERLARRRGLK